MRKQTPRSAYLTEHSRTTKIVYWVVSLIVAVAIGVALWAKREWGNLL